MGFYEKLVIGGMQHLLRYCLIATSISKSSSLLARPACQLQASKFSSLATKSAQLTTKHSAILQQSLSSTATSTKMTVAVVVEAEIKEDRMDEFLKMVENNAVNSRKEEGNIRFDVLKVKDTTNKFMFYEVYKDKDAVAFHKTQDHYKAWADFKASGGTITSVSKVSDGLFLPEN